MREDVTPLQYGLLDCVVERRFPLAFLVSGNLAERINRQAHGAEPAALVAALACLFRRSLIVAKRGPGVSPDLVLHAGEVELAFDDDLEAGCDAWTYYGLTARGGEVWEDLSSPRWDRYVEYGRSYLEEGMGMDEITGMDPDLVERCHGHVRRMYLEGGVDPHGMTRSEFRPWIAFYWKLLPHAYRLAYFVRDELRDPAWATPRKPFAADPEFVTGGPPWYARPFDAVSR
ncbi:MAG TPA: hypothetical protein VFY93_05455 [Planctomycetota bacterium]|nr:hypothetical protein [Planctomycetota bacterium]